MVRAECPKAGFDQTSQAGCSHLHVPGHCCCCEWMIFALEQPVKAHCIWHHCLCIPLLAGSLDFNKPELLASGKVFFLNTCPLVPATVEELKRSWRDSATWLILIVSCVFMVCWQLASLSLNPVGWAATSFYIANNRIVCFYTGATYVTQNRSDTSQERCIYYSGELLLQACFAQLHSF